VPTSNNRVWAELIQLIPIISFALPFIIRGGVDLGRANQGFLVAALLTLPVSAVVLRNRYLLNPILIGTGVWLWLGAIAFNGHIELLRALLLQTQGFGLFLAVFACGVVTTLCLPSGYIGCRHPDVGWVKRASLSLLALSGGAVVWAYYMRTNIRLGGGIPFVVLNVVRRVVIVRTGRVAGSAT
jgi:hypothetical protein